MRHSHFRIIHDDAEVIQRLLHRFCDDEISKLGRIELDLTANKVGEGDHLVGIFEADDFIAFFALFPFRRLKVRNGFGRKLALF